MPSPSPPPTRLCASCGRRFAWRRRWARNWPQVRYCSERCRRRRVRPLDRRLEDAIHALLSERAGTICPSDAARALRPDGWRALMEPTRAAARRMAARDAVIITQGGRPVDPTDARGAIRIARGPAFDGG